jgi:hypothetical protein
MFARFRKAKTGRLHVSLVEPKRTNGTVKQVHVAALGSLASTTAEARREFWLQLEERFARLANRLGPDIDKLRTSIADRIPIPSDGEIEVEAWEQLKADYQDIIDRDRKHAEETMQEARETEKFIGPVVDKCATNIRNVQVRITEGDESAISESAENRKEATMALGTIVAARMGTERKS